MADDEAVAERVLDETDDRIGEVWDGERSRLYWERVSRQSGSVVRVRLA